MKVTLDVNIPEGYEATGELRIARTGEWYLHQDESKAVKCVTDTFYRMLILRRKKRKEIVFVPDPMGAFIVNPYSPDGLMCEYKPHEDGDVPRYHREEREV